MFPNSEGKGEFSSRKGQGDKGVRKTGKHEILNKGATEIEIRGWGWG